MKVKASEFMGRSAGRKPADVPTVVVSKRPSGASSGKATKKRAFFNVDSLETVVSTFDENERALRVVP